MKNHTRVYLDHFDYTIADYIPCIWCGGSSVDIHHINGRGKGKDEIKNLVALCRICHELAHSNRDFNKEIEAKHLKALQTMRSDTD